MRFIAVFILLLQGFVSSAALAKDYVLVLTSQRNAETVADGARLFANQYPHLKVVARSDTQLWEMAPKERIELIKNSRGLLGMGLYGASVAELAPPQLKTLRKPLLIMNSDHRLMTLSRVGGQSVFDSQETLQALAKAHPEDDFYGWLDRLIEQHPKQKTWITGRSYWQAGGSENTAQMLAWFYHQLGENTEFSRAKPFPRLRWSLNGALSEMPPQLDSRPVVAIVDHAGGDRPADAAMLDQLCAQVIDKTNSQCLTALAYWGEAGVQAVEHLQTLDEQLTAVVMLQDFVIGGGEGREKVNQLFKTLNVPVIKAIKLRDRSAVEYHLSADGLAAEKVYYQIAMPELQGASQPLVVATAGAEKDDALTGIRIKPITPLSSGIQSIVERLKRWQVLQNKSNADKRVAIVYYNHPPGRHNIGADNLDVPGSLWQILQSLTKAGYHTGTLPESQEALLDLLQERGVNLPRDAAALAAMSQRIPKVNSSTYEEWFKTLPKTVQQEMEFGPFGLLNEQINQAIQAGKPELALDAVHHMDEEMHHMLEGVDHKGRDRAMALLEQLETCYLSLINKTATQCDDAPLDIISALQKTGIEGMGGWGKAPGNVMTVKGDLLLPGLQFGNIFIGPQPPRGWEINEELLHANLAFPPPHQYLAFYQYLRETFKADALVHLGRHSTYEFLPRRSVGVAEDDYSRVVAGDLPGIYPYIVDGVGEGIQAKRRGLAVMVDHLTPPLKSTPLYDELLQLRQMVESFEAMHASDNHAGEDRLVAQIREKIDSLELKQELAEAMSAELAVMGISFDEVDDDMLVHEIGHYLTDLQERFMPLGLHIYGKDWDAEAVTMMLESMAPEGDEQAADWRKQLTDSPQAELDGLLRGLSGGFIEPGQGNDPIRSPTSLPTGRNFYALDSSLIPSPIAWEIGQEMAANARATNPQNADKSEALILWASDVVRDEGVMIAFGLDMLGIKPVWNSRGLVQGLERQPLVNGRVRRDMVFTTSGLFRDLYAQQMMLLNRATLMALDASADTIIQQYPALTLALRNALEPLDKDAQGGRESLEKNQVAAHWVTQARQLLAEGFKPEQAGVLASFRVFGDAPGSYGAGINRLAERSGAWEKREELASVYVRRIGHSYGAEGFGAPAQKVFESVLSNVENTYFGRSSNLYGLIDNNDAFDYLGGLSLSIETLTGSAPNNFVLDHSDPNNIKAQPLATALRQELRGRFLNPEWLEALMEHGYAGARTMGSEFLEYLWGWQITNPTLVGDWAWEEVKAVYIDDRYELQLDEFLEQGHNAHVKSNMLAVMLVAIHKEFWNADSETTADLAKQFAELVAQNGLPGSGHTDPDHPMLPWLEQHLSDQDWQQLSEVIAKAMPDKAVSEEEVLRITELNETLNQTAEASNQDDGQQDERQTDSESNTSVPLLWRWMLVAAVLSVIASGFYRAVRRSRQV